MRYRVDHCFVGRLDRFCIDQSSFDDIDLKTKLLPATVMSCKQMLVLQAPRYMGCTAPRTDASLWCIVELYTATCMAKPDDPTALVMWLPIFEGRVVPPPIDLLHRKVYCYSEEDKTRLMRNLSRCPGGLEAVQDAMAAVWPYLFEDAYDDWRALREAAEHGSLSNVQQLLSNGAYTDLPSNDEIQPLAAAIVSKVEAIASKSGGKSRLKPSSSTGSIASSPGPNTKHQNSRQNSTPRLSVVSGAKDSSGIDHVIAALAKAGASRRRRTAADGGSGLAVLVPFPCIEVRMSRSW